MVSTVVITANGQGSRMKCLSPKPKHHLYYKDKRIIDHLKELFPNAMILEGLPSRSRKETLAYLDYENCLIIDCDVIPDKIEIGTAEDALFYFESNKDKYSSIQVENGRVIKASENTRISCYKCSGVYFVKSIRDLLARMTTDSIAEAMVGAVAIPEDTFIKLGDPTDYYESLGIKGGSFTGNKITFNEKTVIKHCSTGPAEKNWYDMATCFNLPKVRYADDEMIITERLYPTDKPSGEDFIRLIGAFRNTIYMANDSLFETYRTNLKYPEGASGNTRELIYPEHKGSFFHGDLSTNNVLKDSRLWLIDPNYKDVFGSWLTDAGKAVFSLIAYEMNYPEAKKIIDHFGKDVLKFAVAEGLRVCKYKPEYISIVNNIADLTTA